MENIADSTSRDSSKYLILRLYHVQHHTVANHQLIFLCLHTLAASGRSAFCIWEQRSCCRSQSCAATR